MADENSATWAAHIRRIFLLYGLPNPTNLLNSPPWPKTQWKNHVKAAVISYHEANWRQKAASNSKLNFLNVQTIGLCCKPYPTLRWVRTSHDATTIRPQIKMLAGDYQCFKILGRERGIDPSCRLCVFRSRPGAGALPLIEDIVHILTECRSTYDTRSRIMPQLLNIIAQHIPDNLLLATPTNQELSQFLLDCTSLNLQNGLRLSPAHPALDVIAKQCSNLVYAVHTDRITQLKEQVFYNNDIYI